MKHYKGIMGSLLIFSASLILTGCIGLSSTDRPRGSNPPKQEYDGELPNASENSGNGQTLPDSGADKNANGLMY